MLSKHSKHLLLTLSCFLFIGCGFSPVYKETADKHLVQADLSQIKIQSIKDREGQILRNYLLDAVDNSQQHQNALIKYELRTNLDKTTQSLGSKKDGTATRERVLYKANYNLYDLRSGRILSTFESTSSLNYNLVPEQFAIIAAQSSSETKALKGLSHTMITRLSLYFKNRKHEDTNATN